mmetsp:Transcript_5302/g.9955  ORF Transcript_5302/g.9955 Transcript_5302/m.9955 type:complete len:87 (-) Transcript_5302:2159-2419(-)
MVVHPVVIRFILYTPEDGWVQRHSGTVQYTSHDPVLYSTALSKCQMQNCSVRRETVTRLHITQEGTVVMRNGLWKHINSKTMEPDG